MGDGAIMPCRGIPLSFDGGVDYDATSYDASAGILLAAYLVPVGMSTKAPPAASETSAASRMRTTLRPSRASLRGVVPSMMHSEKWRPSIASGSLPPMWGLTISPWRQERWN